MALTSYTLADLQKAAKIATGKAAPATVGGAGPADWTTLVNDALENLFNAHPWNWRSRPLALDVVGSTNSSAVRTSNVVSVTTSTAHNLAVGDFVAVSGATASFNGTFVVASVSSSTIYGYNQTGSDETAGTAGSTYPGHILLPTDFGELEQLWRRGAVTQMQKISPPALTRLRAGGIVGGDFSAALGNYFAVTSQPQTAATAVPRQRVELYPIPTAVQTAQFVGSYLKLFSALSGSTDVPDLPYGFHGLAYSAVRAWAVLRENRRRGIEWEEYERMLEAARRLDAGQDVILGPLDGNHVSTPSTFDYLQPGSITSQ